MQNFITTIVTIIIAVTSMILSTNLSIYARTMQNLKEDLEIAVHDSSLQLNTEELSKGKIVFDKDKALDTFKESFELNSGILPSEYEIIEFKVFDHSNTSFPIEYQSSKTDFKDTFIYPTVLAIVRTYTDKYFFTSEVKPVTRIASYSYKINNKDSVFEDITIDIQPNGNGFYWIVPYTTRITSYFTPYRINPITNEIEFHKGIDISDKNIFGKPVISAKKGTVTFAGIMNGYGNIVEISHGSGLFTRYAHLNTIVVNTGDTVEGGEVIGTVGNTGQSTAPHLHFEVIYNGKHVNPLIFYTETGE